MKTLNIIGCGRAGRTLARQRQVDCSNRNQQEIYRRWHFNSRKVPIKSNRNF